MCGSAWIFFIQRQEIILIRVNSWFCYVIVQALVIRLPDYIIYFYHTRIRSLSYFQFHYLFYFSNLIHNSSYHLNDKRLIYAITYLLYNPRFQMFTVFFIFVIQIKWWSTMTIILYVSYKRLTKNKILTVKNQ